MSRSRAKVGGTAMFGAVAPNTADLGIIQLGWLALAVFVVSAGYGALMPMFPGWLRPMMPGADDAEIARHVGLLGAAYTVGVLVGAPLWGRLSDGIGRGRVLVLGLSGYVASLALLLGPGSPGVPAVYVLRTLTGLSVAAVVPVVPALVAGYTPQARRARRFAWLGAVSLVGFLFGPALTSAAGWLAARSVWLGPLPAEPVSLIILISALLGAVTMGGIAMTLPRREPDPDGDSEDGPSRTMTGSTSGLWVLNSVVMFVLAGFELGIVLQGQRHPGLSSSEVARMFAECSLVMLGVNVLLFATELLDRVDSRRLLAAGLTIASVGLAVLALHRTGTWMYAGVALTAAGTGLVLPVIAYLAAAAPQRRLGTAMGGLAAAAGLGQSLGSSVGGWLFGAVDEATFAWLTLPLLATLATLLVRPRWWIAQSVAPPSR